MKIPGYYYQDFWITNTLLSLGTGGVLGIMFSRLAPFLIVSGISLDSPVLSFFILYVIAYQGAFFSYFCGKRRGAFEFSYFESTIGRGTANPDVKKLLSEAKQELKLGDPKAANLKLREVVMLDPENFVLHFKYALSCENIGLATESIEAYGVALKKASDTSEHLTSYLVEQIERVKTKGPSNKSSVPGLRYVIY